MHTSMAMNVGNVVFPEFTGERVYMRAFNKRNGLPNDLNRWQPTVDSMLLGIDTDEDMYLMIDQGVVQAGDTHRRAGKHIDGYWIPDLMCHRGRGDHIGSWDNGGGWNTCSFDKDEALVLASDVKACAAYIGEWDGTPGEGGDCEHIDVSSMQKLNLEPQQVYVGNVAMIHESLPVPVNCQRTLVRINVPGFSFNA